MTNCGVIGCSPTRPRTPSVPKYFLLTLTLHSPHSKLLTHPPSHAHHARALCLPRVAPRSTRRPRWLADAARHLVRSARPAWTCACLLYTSDAADEYRGVE